jgi:hypothetical protein
MAGADYLGMDDNPPESLIKFPQDRLWPVTAISSLASY